MKKILVMGLACIIANIACATTSVQLDRTRIVMKNGANKAQIAMSNNQNNPVLVSASITDFDGQTTKKFTVSPAVIQVKPRTTYKSSIIQLESLPQDRESVFWLNVKTVAPHDPVSDDASTLQFAIGQRIKLFYRPEGIDQTCETAAEAIQWLRTKDGIKAINNSKLALSLVKIKSEAGVSEIGDTIMPMSEREYKVNIRHSLGTVFTFVDEYGAFIDKAITFK